MNDDGRGEKRSRRKELKKEEEKVSVWIVDVDTWISGWMKSCRHANEMHAILR